MTIKDAELEAIAKVCIKENILIISDEIYGLFSFDGKSASLYDIVLDAKHLKCIKLIVKHLKEKKIAHIIFKTVKQKFWKYGFIKRPKTKRNLINHHMPKEKLYMTFCDSDWD